VSTSSDFHFVLIDKTNGGKCTNGDQVTPAVLGQLATFLTVYANEHVAGEYGGKHVVRAGSSPTDLLPGEIPVDIDDTLVQPGAIAYHTTGAGGAPDVEDGLTLSDSMFGPGNSVSCALSHEVAETIGDEACNLTALSADGSKGYAREACDPVEEQTFPISLPASGTLPAFTAYASNFVLRSYFNPGAPAPYDYMSSQDMSGATPPPGPFQPAPSGDGNYQIVYSSVGASSQVTALQTPAERPHLPARVLGEIGKKRLGHKMRPESRSRRRGLRFGPDGSYPRAT
jgi:hypothetical protein